MSLRIEGLGKTYPGGVRALIDFNLEMREGEFVAMLGPSGCGKSTLLRLVAGLEDESSGTLRLGDRVLNGLPPKDRDVAIVFQSFTLLPHLTVAENMGFGMKLRGIPKEKRRAQVRETANLLGLEGLLGRYPAEISGGERQRAALGRSILRHPKLFLFDEPLSSLDAQMRLQLRVEIQRLHRRLGTPMLFVTHDQGEALTLGQRVVVLHQGRIQQIADPETLLANPANAFVASFVGNPGMNLFPGRVDRSGSFPRFVGSALEFPLTPAHLSHVGSRERITAAMRPEHLQPSSRPLLSGTLTALERQGMGICLYLQTSPGQGGVSFAVKLPGNHGSVAPGAVHGFTPDPEQILFFDADSGTRLEA
jgi:ABC-type sugar transport system ATPase subunit